MVNVLGIDLASQSWKANGSALLRFSIDPPSWTTALPGIVRWPPIVLSPAALAAAIDAAAIANAVSAVSLDGPQGWRDPDALERSGVGRHCEYVTLTQGKTGPYGRTYPSNQVGWIGFCIEVFTALVSRPHVHLANAPLLNRLAHPVAGHYYVLECFPTSTWRTAGLRPLPGKRRSSPGTVAAHTAELTERFQLPNFVPDSHDDLQAVVAALPAAGLLGGPCSAIPRGISGSFCEPKDTRPAHWIEGLIWDAIPAGAEDCLMNARSRRWPAFGKSDA